MQTFVTSNLKIFACDRTAHCCQNWDIYFNKNTINRVNSMPSGTFPGISADTPYYKVVHENNYLYYAALNLVNRKCPFLSEDNDCLIFKQFGKENGNPLCVVFPFMKLKLKDRHAIINFWSCVSETENLFNNTSLYTEILPSENIYSAWPGMDFSDRNHVLFSKNIQLTWEAFYFLQDYILDELLNKNLSVWQILSVLCLLNDKISSSDTAVLSAETIKEYCENIYQKELCFSNSASVLFFFIKRKINLYRNPEFIEQLKAVLELKEKSYFSDTDRILFYKELEHWDKVFKKYLFLRLFYNPNIFLHSVQLYWHIILFYLNFIKIYLYPLWQTNNTISKQNIIKAILILEKNFMHDPHIFEFWGHPRFKELELNNKSLYNLMVS